MPPKAQQKMPPPMPAKKYREYRSTVLPALGGLTWMGYKQMTDNASEHDYAQLMGKVIASPDLNDLIQNQLTIFDENAGMLKTVATLAAKIVELSAAKVVQTNKPPPVQDSCLSEVEDS